MVTTVHSGKRGGVTWYQKILPFFSSFGHSGPSGVSENSPNEFPMPQNLGIDTKIKSLACSEPKLQILPFSSLFWLTQNGHKWPFQPLRPIGGVWKWSQWISHAQKPGDRHQNQFSSLLRTKVTDLTLYLANQPYLEAKSRFSDLFYDDMDI